MILILRCVCATLIPWDILDPLVYFTYNKKRIKPSFDISFDDVTNDMLDITASNMKFFKNAVWYFM